MVRCESEARERRPEPWQGHETLLQKFRLGNQSLLFVGTRLNLEQALAVDRCQRCMRHEK